MAFLKFLGDDPVIDTECTIRIQFEYIRNRVSDIDTYLVQSIWLILNDTPLLRINCEPWLEIKVIQNTSYSLNIYYLRVSRRDTYLVQSIRLILNDPPLL